MLHFAQTAIALVAAGASVLIVGGLVRETLREGGEHLHLFPDTHEPIKTPAATPVEVATTKDATPFLRAQGENARSRHDNDRESRRERQKKERRQTRRRERPNRDAGESGSATTADGEDA